MERKILLFSIGAALLLTLTCIPTGAINAIINDDSLTTDSTEENLSNTIKYNVIHAKGKRDYEKKVIELSVEDSEAMWKEFKSLESEDLTPAELFEAKFEIMKNYEIVSSDMTLDDVVNVDKFSEEYTEIQSQDFDAAFAPILFLGGGLGFGMGVPLWLTSGSFLVAMFGFGMVYCYDPLKTFLHNMTTFFFIPFLVGYLGGFTGILLLPVVPGFFYSNFLGLGMVAVTVWKFIPSLY